MSLQNEVKRALAEFDKNPDYVLEDVLLDVTEQIAVAMDEKGVTRKELAERMGVTAPVITRLLRGAENTTLRTLLRIAFALDMIIDVELGKPAAVAERRAATERERESVARRPDQMQQPPPVLNVPASLPDQEEVHQHTLALAA